MGDTAIRFENVSKRFRIGQSHDSLRDLLAAALRRVSGRSASRSRHEVFWALHDVDFSVRQGEAVGIIGPNGAGKSTVLKLLAGILRPDGGRVSVTGRLAALIEIGAGFHGDLTGRENIYLNGAIMGMRRVEVRAKLDAIVDFAGIERFLDTPVKRYSSGMYARLGFSIASHVDPEILLVDEVLSVGDAVFRLRCMERMHALVRGGTTLVFVTHQLDQMQSICKTAIVLEGGRSVFQGSSRQAVAEYLQAVSRSMAVRPTDLADSSAGDESSAAVTELRFADQAGRKAVWLNARDALRVSLSFRLSRDVSRLVIELNMRGTMADNLLSFNTARQGHTINAAAGSHEIDLWVPSLPISGGQYFWNVRMWDADRGTTLVDTPYQYPLVINDDGRSTGVVNLDHAWTLDERTSSKLTLSARSSASPEMTESVT